MNARKRVHVRYGTLVCLVRYQSLPVYVSVDISTHASYLKRITLWKLRFSIFTVSPCPTVFSVGYYECEFSTSPKKTGLFGGEGWPETITEFLTLNADVWNVTGAQVSRHAQSSYRTVSGEDVIKQCTECIVRCQRSLPLPFSHHPNPFANDFQRRELITPERRNSRTILAPCPVPWLTPGVLARSVANNRQSFRRTAESTRRDPNHGRNNTVYAILLFTRFPERCLRRIRGADARLRKISNDFALVLGTRFPRHLCTGRRPSPAAAGRVFFDGNYQRKTKTNPLPTRSALFRAPEIRRQTRSKITTNTKFDPGGLGATRVSPNVFVEAALTNDRNRPVLHWF